MLRVRVLQERKCDKFSVLPIFLQLPYNDVNINKKLPREQRLEDYVRQIGNPYCYKCGEAIVKISFSETTATLEDRIENYLKTF